MALTLTGAPFIAAQDSQSRHPLVEIIASQWTADIPFDGSLLTSETLNESKPNVITHSSGRLCAIFTFDQTPSAILKYVYTDITRSTFSFVTIPANGVPDEASLCEMDDGNILIVYRDVDGGNNRLRRLVVSPIGVVVSADALIESFATDSYVIQGPFVIKI
jgi:hypothetical protein